jgi:hypothetical protein
VQRQQTEVPFSFPSLFHYNFTAEIAENAEKYLKVKKTKEKSLLQKNRHSGGNRSADIFPIFTGNTGFRLSPE